MNIKVNKIIELKAQTHLAKTTLTREGTAPLDRKFETTLSEPSRHSTRSSPVKSTLQLSHSFSLFGRHLPKSTIPKLSMRKAPNFMLESTLPSGSFRPTTKASMAIYGVMSICDADKKLKPHKASGKKIMQQQEKFSFNPCGFMEDDENIGITDEYLDQLGEVIQYLNPPIQQIYDTTDMDFAEALQAIIQLQDNTYSSMQLCYGLSSRKGYKALGYDDFKTCIEEKLKGYINYDYALKMKNAGEVHLVVCPELSMGEVPESVLRPMHKLSDEVKKEVWEKAYNERGGKTTATVVLNAIKEVQGLKVNLYDSEISQRLFNFDPSSELVEQLDEAGLALIKEFFKKCPPLDLYTDTTISKGHFEKTVKFVLRRLGYRIVDQYKEYTFSVKSGMTKI